jgi:hypothetical protein
LFESGTPAERALAGVTIRTKGAWPAGNKSNIHKQCAVRNLKKRFKALWERFLTAILAGSATEFIAVENRSHNHLSRLQVHKKFLF